MRTDTEFLKFIEGCKEEFGFINEGALYLKNLEAFYAFVRAKIEFEKANK